MHRGSPLLTLLLLATTTGTSLESQSKPPVPISIVDYLKSIGQKSNKADRARLFGNRWKGEAYKGTAAQNIKLLKALLRERKELLIPVPSPRIANCAAFYNDKKVARFLTRQFQKNAVRACIVTGTATPQAKIRKALQELYKTQRPANGETFTAVEHKEIHDAAYKKAGCREDSAGILGWHAVNLIDPEKVLTKKQADYVIRKAIEVFGPCTVGGK